MKNNFQELIQPYVEKIIDKTISKREINDLLILFYPIINKKADKYKDIKGVDLVRFIVNGGNALNRAISTYDASKEASFYTYALTCIENAILDEARRQSKGSANTVAYNDSYEIDISQQNLMGYIAMKREIKERLSSFEYQVFEMHVDGYSYEEIANKFNKTKKDIDNSIQQIRKKLKPLF